MCTYGWVGVCVANDNINSFAKCQRKPPWTFPCQSAWSREVEQAEREACRGTAPVFESIAKFLPTLTVACSPIVGTTPTTTEAEAEAELSVGVACLSVTVTVRLQRKGNAFKQFFIYIFIKTNHTENVICKKHKAMPPQAPSPLHLPSLCLCVCVFFEQVGGWCWGFCFYQRPATAHNSLVSYLFIFCLCAAFAGPVQKCAQVRRQC